MSGELTIESLMMGMPKAFQPEKAGKTNVIIQFQLSGAEAGDWAVTIQDGTCTVQKGTVANPNMTLIADSQVYKDVITGKVVPMKAMMDGSLKLQGDFSAAMKLVEFFKMS